jgi:hypothetical protein
MESLWSSRMSRHDQELATHIIALNAFLPGSINGSDQKVFQASVRSTYCERNLGEFLLRSGLVALFEQSKTLAHFDDVHRSWQTAIRNFNVGTPKKLEADSPAEKEQQELLFLELRHCDPCQVYEKFSSLIRKRLVSNDKHFLRWLTKTRERRDVPNEAGLSLSYYILCTWEHSFLWGLSNDERADILFRAHGIPIDGAPGGRSEVVRKTVDRLGLKGWSDFRRVYPKAPFLLTLFSEAAQESCQFSVR